MVLIPVKTLDKLMEEWRKDTLRCLHREFTAKQRASETPAAAAKQPVLWSTPEVEICNLIGVPKPNLQVMVKAA